MDSSSKLLKEVRANLVGHQLLKPGSRVLVAVSGGLDSMVLLHVLRALTPEFDLQITVAHFDHGLRGRSSAADARFVQATCLKLGVPFLLEHARVAELAHTTKVSVEMAGREARHEFLARTARREKINCVALAHHADDQVELFFLRLLRGSGSEGLAGMKWKAASPADPEVRLIRPLLSVSKAGLREYARSSKIEYREDRTNQCTDFERNKVRHVLLPLIRRNFQPAVDACVLRLIELVGSEGEFCAREAERWLVETGSKAEQGKNPHGGGVRTNALYPQAAQVGQGCPQPAGEDEGRGATLGVVGKRKSRKVPVAEQLGFSELPMALQRQVLRLQLLRSDVVADFTLVEQLRKEPGQWRSAGRRRWVRRQESGLVEIQTGCLGRFGDQGTQEVLLKESPGQATFGGAELRWELAPSREGEEPFEVQLSRLKSANTLPSQGRETFDADRVGVRIVLRHWRPGDRFQPIGMKRPVKLQDLFVNQKVLRKQRHELILATTAEGEVFWVEGLRISERFKLLRSTRQQLRWSWQRL